MLNERLLMYLVAVVLLSLFALHPEAPPYLLGTEDDAQTEDEDSGMVVMR